MSRQRQIICRVSHAILETLKQGQFYGQRQRKVQRQCEGKRKCEGQRQCKGRDGSSGG